MKGNLVMEEEIDDVVVNGDDGGEGVPQEQKIEGLMEALAEVNEELEKVEKQRKKKLLLM